MNLRARDKYLLLGAVVALLIAGVLLLTRRGDDPVTATAPAGANPSSGADEGQLPPPPTRS